MQRDWLSIYYFERRYMTEEEPEGDTCHLQQNYIFYVRASFLVSLILYRSSTTIFPFSRGHRMPVLRNNDAFILKRSSNLQTPLHDIKYFVDSELERMSYPSPLWLILTVGAVASQTLMKVLVPNPHELTLC